MPFGIYSKVIRILLKECPRLDFTLRTYSIVIIARSKTLSRASRAFCGKLISQKYGALRILRTFDFKDIELF